MADDADTESIGVEVGKEITDEDVDWNDEMNVARNGKEDVETGKDTNKKDAVDAANEKEPAPQGLKYYDHYSLLYPSSSVRFRTSAASHRVYEGNRSQMVVEERDDQVIVKRTSDTTAGVICLRAIYTAAALLWSGFLFVFCTQLLIFLVMDLAAYLGATTGNEVAVGRAVGTILSFPLFVHGLASALIIDGHFVSDTWAGHYLIKTLIFGGLRSVLSAWIAFGVYFGLPLLVMCICLFAGIQDFWKITALFWFAAVCVFYIVFVFVIIYFEIKACLEITGNEFSCKGFQLLKKCILLRQVHTYSGYKHRIFLNRGSLRELDRVNQSVIDQSAEYSQTLLSRFKRWPFLQKLGLYERIPEPGQRLHPIEEASGVRPFVTHNTWR